MSGVDRDEIPYIAVMDEYLAVRKPTTTNRKHASYLPGTKLNKNGQRWPKSSTRYSVDGRKPSSSAITRCLLSTLRDNSNPITHSNIYERSDTIVSATSGHQRGEGRTPHGASAKAYFEHRSKKLSIQRGDVPLNPAILRNVRVYIDGYLDGTTDIEMKRIIANAGGSTLLRPSGATHIVTAQQLNGSKTHKVLTAESGNLVHVVKPEWIIDSVSAGRRLQESRYALIKSSSTRNIVDMLKPGKSG